MQPRSPFGRNCGHTFGKESEKENIFRSNYENYFLIKIKLKMLMGMIDNPAKYRYTDYG